MTKLGASVQWGSNMITHAKKLRDLQPGAIVRNGCDTTDPLSKGTFFLKKNAGDEWDFFNPTTRGAVTPDVGVFTSDAIFLPAEQISAQRINDFYADLRLEKELVERVRTEFEDYADVDAYCLLVDHEYSSDPDEFHRVDNERLRQAWLLAVKEVIRWAGQQT